MRKYFVLLPVLMMLVTVALLTDSTVSARQGSDPVCYTHTDSTLRTPVDVPGISSEFVVAKVYHKKSTWKDSPIRFSWYDGVRLLDEHSHPNSPVYANTWEVKANDLYVENHATVDYSNIRVEVCYGVRPSRKIEVDYIEFEIWWAPYPF